MNNITKGDLLRFVKSYEPFYEVKEDLFRQALYHIIKVCETYYLHDKPDDYILEDWQYEDILYEQHVSNSIDLRPIFEKFHKVYLREQIINKILDES